MNNIVKICLNKVIIILKVIVVQEVFGREIHVFGGEKPSDKNTKGPEYAF